MTPLDLFAQLGIPYGGVTIRIDVLLRLTCAGIRDYLGWDLDRCSPRVSIPQGVLISHLATSGLM